MGVAVESLLELPAGASYRAKSGQAGAEVTVINDTVYVTATCDSVMREVELYEELYHAARDALEEAEALNECLSREWESR